MADEDEWQRLLVKAKDGQLSERELDQVASVLQDPLRRADDQVWQAAVSIAGEFLRNTWNDKLFEALLDIATNEHNSHETRVAVILTLARAVGGGRTTNPLSKRNGIRNAFDQAFKEASRQERVMQVRRQSTLPIVLIFLAFRFTKWYPDQVRSIQQRAGRPDSRSAHPARFTPGNLRRCDDRILRLGDRQRSPSITATGSLRHGRAGITRTR